MGVGEHGLQEFTLSKKNLAYLTLACVHAVSKLRSECLASSIADIRASVTLQERFMNTARIL